MSSGNDDLIVVTTDGSIPEEFENLENLLDQISSHRNSPLDSSNRAAYCRRLQRFTSVNYFAKPVEISPIMCALTGWEIVSTRNVDRLETSVLLQCSDCMSKMAVLIPPGLSYVSGKKLAAHFQQQLWKSHSEACKQRNEVEYLLCAALDEWQQQISKGVATTNVPSLVARILPPPTLDLLEHTNPWQAFKNRLTKIILHIQPLNVTTIGGASEDFVPIVENVVAKFQKIQEDNTDTETRIDKQRDQNYLQLATALVLTGWDVKDQSIECSFCLSCQHLDSPSTLVSQEEEEQPQQKKRHIAKWNYPMDSHRYFCPWVCGMGSTRATENATPFWRFLSNKLLKDGTEENDSEIPPVIAVHNVLKESLSSRGSIQAEFFQ